MFRCTGKLLKLLAKGQVSVWKRTTFDRDLWHTFSSAECAVFRVSYPVFLYFSRHSINILDAFAKIVVSML